MAKVVLEQVGKTYPGGVRAVDNLTLTVKDGELLVLVGPSGCGKTTTLRLIAGLEAPTEGILRLDGEDVNGVPPWRRSVAFAFQKPALYPHRTVRANLGLGLVLAQRHGWPRRALRWLLSATARQAGRDRRADLCQRVAQAARTLGLEEVLERYPAQLSGGQQQRVALGRALIRRPAVLLLDEPLGHLDACQRLELRRELLLLHRRLPATMVYVTHDPVEALALGDRVAVLRAGALQQVGRPRDVYERPASCFVASSVGWPPMSFLDGELRWDAGRFWLEGSGGRLVLPPPDKQGWAAFAGQPVTLGIRPEDLELRLAGLDEQTVKEASLEMEVALVELQGGRALVSCARHGWQVAVLATTPQRLEGRKVMVDFRLAKAHLFDRATGLALDADDRTD
jgi:multiple sugar transport system ATP-binding protein